jgi:hypothetical protein
MYLRNVILAALVLAMAAFGQTIATANAVLDGPYQVRYAANLAAGESYIDIVNDGYQGASLLGPGFGAGTIGNICVSVYAIDPGEELDSCCSCLITPDQVVHLGAVADLISNTANGVKPTSITIKLLASIPAGGASATSCATQAATVTSATLVSGMDAWGTTLHPAPGSTTTFITTETPFTNAALSGGELASLTGRCASIVGNLSGAGICTSCHNGALGASAIN